MRPSMESFIFKKPVDTQLLGARIKDFLRATEKMHLPCVGLIDWMSFYAYGIGEKQGKLKIFYSPISIHAKTEGQRLLRLQRMAKNVSIQLVYDFRFEVLPIILMRRKPMHGICYIAGDANFDRRLYKFFKKFGSDIEIVGNNAIEGR